MYIHLFFFLLASLILILQEQKNEEIKLCEIVVTNITLSYIVEILYIFIQSILFKTIKN